MCRARLDFKAPYADRSILLLARCRCGKLQLEIFISRSGIALTDSRAAVRTDGEAKFLIDELH